MLFYINVVFKIANVGIYQNNCSHKIILVNECAQLVEWVTERMTS